MIYPQNFEELVGFSPIRAALIEACRLQSASELAREFGMITDKKRLEDTLDLLDECHRIMTTRPSLFEWSQVIDMAPLLKHVPVEGYFLVEEEWLGVAGNIQIYDAFASSLVQADGEFPHFASLFPKHAETKLLLGEIRNILDEDGHIRNNASAIYQKVSTEIQRLEKEARIQTKQIFREWKQLGYTADTDVTIREERLVIPVIAEFKRKVKGFVKDVSATGKVLFMEPAAIVELNNRLKELFAERKRERERILKALTAAIRPFTPQLLQWMQVLTQVDFVFAKYQISQKFGAERPNSNVHLGIVLKEAVHPVLKQELLKQNQPMVPLNLEMSDKRVIVVSGPNAGGKSVVLKTTLLLQYWYQCGFFITAKPESSMGHFEFLGIDCGDGQSLEAGLSTFSAHLHHLKQISEHASSQALVGLDELGSGTDPRYGAPIAQVVLEQLLEKGAFVIATTHFSQIREWGSQESAVMQASMAYDAMALKPLFRFIQGKPGSSFALELMRKTGFKSPWIDRINEIAGVTLGRTEDLMLEWEQKNQQLQQLIIENAEKNRHLSLMVEDYAHLKQKLADKRKLAMDQTKKEVANLLSEANRRIEQTIRIIQENKADKNKTLKARAQLQEYKNDVIKKADRMANQPETIRMSSEISSSEIPDHWKPIPGERVKNRDTDQAGEVVEVKKDRALVIFGIIKMWLPIAEIRPTQEIKKKKHSAVKGIQWVERQAAFQSELDLRGTRTEEAKQKLTLFLDEAYALGHATVKIVHGKGDGILRKMLREHLKSLNYVKEYVNEHAERGGDGCTLIYLN